LIQKEINFDGIAPQDILGLHHKNVKLFQKFHSKLKFTSRGDTLIVAGAIRDFELFENHFSLLLKLASKQGNFTEIQLIEIFSKQDSNAFNDLEIEEKIIENDIILYGNGGKVIRAKTPNQKKMVELMKSNDILFAIGPAGTGKTYTAVALAVKALKNKEIKRIILARPAVEAGENLGFLPGDLKEKIDPYLRPLYDALDDMIQPEKLKNLIETRVIEIAPMAFMRGRTLDNAYVILDEAQNATDLQLKMFLPELAPMQNL